MYLFYWRHPSMRRFSVHAVGLFAPANQALSTLLAGVERCCSRRVTYCHLHQYQACAVFRCPSGVPRVHRTAERCPHVQEPAEVRGFTRPGRCQRSAGVDILPLDAAVCFAPLGLGWMRLGFWAFARKGTMVCVFRCRMMYTVREGEGVTTNATQAGGSRSSISFFVLNCCGFAPPPPVIRGKRNRFLSQFSTRHLNNDLVFVCMEFNRVL